MLNRFRKQLSELGITQEDKILVAVSGGVDSMVLSDLLLRCNIRHNIAHIDHHTRKGQSTEDRMFVEDYARFKGLKCYVHNLHYDVSKGNFHNWAHKERYRFFSSLEYDKILTAHHDDDEVETIFLNFISGRSLSGIPHLNASVVRPLLVFSKEEIISFADEYKIEYREDVSNSENKYLRNLIRNQFLPELYKSVDKNIGLRVKSLAKRIKKDQDLLKSLISQSVTHKNIDGRFYVPINQLSGQSSTFLYYVIKEYGFSREICEQIHSCYKSKGASFSSGDMHCIIGDEQLVISKSYEEWEPLRIDLNDVPLSIIIDDYRYTLTLREQASDLRNEHTCIVPMHSLKESLIIRRWQYGDRMHPYGMGGDSKKLKKIFADLKLDLFQKQRIPIFTTENDILWVTSLVTSEKYKVNSRGPYLCIERLISL